MDNNISCNGCQLDVKISAGNMKLGKMLNISLPPVQTCPNGIPCAKDCYAMKAYRLYPNVKKAWDANLQALNDSEKAFFATVTKKIAKAKNKEFFRWHQAGDITSQSYLEGMKEVADKFPETQFLAFTKNRDLDYSDLPANMTVVASQWSEYIWGANLPKAIMRAKGETWETPKNAMVCPGACKDCKYCWNMTDGQAVIFDQH